MLGVFLWPVFACLGHECQDHLSLCDGMYASTEYTSVYTLIRKSYREWSQNTSRVPDQNGISHACDIVEIHRSGPEPLTCSLHGEKSPLSEGSKHGWTSNAASRRTASPTHYRLSYSSSQSHCRQAAKADTPTPTSFLPKLYMLLRHAKWVNQTHTHKKKEKIIAWCPGTCRGRERQAGLATVGGDTLKQSWNSKGPTGPEWPEQPRTECDGEGS